jgi:hypothetical protein
MEKRKRPFRDETLVFPGYRHYYTATVLGHQPGDAHEEPVKLTCALNEAINNDTFVEWNARLTENSIAADYFTRGIFEEDRKALEKFWGGVSEMGVEETMKGMESGEIEAESGVESALEALGGESALEMMEDMLTEDMFTSYGIHPPIINLPLRISPGVMAMLCGSEFDTMYHNMEAASLEQNPFLEDWHYTDGVQMTRLSMLYENAESILDRRHLRTGEKFRYLCCPRPAEEAEDMIVDILKDIRNEKYPEYADTSFWPFPYTDQIGPDCQHTSRSLVDFLGTWLHGFVSTAYKYPFRAYIAWYPMPGILQTIFPYIPGKGYEMTIPIDIVIPKFMSLLGGVNFWMGMYTLTPLATSMEIIGHEMIPPTTDESSPEYLYFGMDRFRLISSFIQSKRAYGEDAHMRIPTPYPCPEKVIMSFNRASEELRKAREEHPEWLTDLKGLTG